MLDSSHSSLDSSVGGVGNKEHLIVLGTGWGAASFLKNIDTDKYDVTVISPRNYFVFTPMLAGASEFNCLIDVWHSLCVYILY